MKEKETPIGAKTLNQERTTILPTNQLATELNSRKSMKAGKLSNVSKLTRNDLIQIIIRSEIPFIDESNLHLQETDVLRQLTTLAIKRCTDPV